MLIRAKCRKVEIAPGVRFVEKNSSCGKTLLLETISTVEVIEIVIRGKVHKRYNWYAMDLKTKEFINYTITEGYEVYAACLFQDIEDANRFWGITD